MNLRKNIKATTMPEPTDTAWTNQNAESIFLVKTVSRPVRGDLIYTISSHYLRSQPLCWLRKTYSKDSLNYLKLLPWNRQNQGHENWITKKTPNFVCHCFHCHILVTGKNKWAVLWTGASSFDRVIEMSDFLNTIRHTSRHFPVLGAQALKKTKKCTAVPHSCFYG